MIKKPIKSKAKRSRTKPLRIPRAPVTRQQFMFDPATDEPTRRYRLRPQSVAEVEAERVARRARQEREAVRHAAFRENRKRHNSMQGRYSLPDDVREFLEQRYHKPLPLPCGEPQIDRKLIEELLREPALDTGLPPSEVERQLHCGFVAVASQAPHLPANTTPDSDPLGVQ